MSKDDLDNIVEAARARRKVSSRCAIDKKANDGTFTTDTFRLVWNEAAPGYPGAWGGTRDMMHAREKLDALLGTICPNRVDAAKEVEEFLAWVVTEWRSLKFRSGTSWMHQKDMLPRQPSMRFVLHHWSHFFASYTDRAQETAHDYEDPLIDELREDRAFLETKLREVAKFGGEAQIARLKLENTKLETENARLRELLSPLVDLDTELPTWEEKQNA